MRTSSTFSVLFWVYSSRANKNNYSTIYARVTVNGKRVGISLKTKIDINTWSADRQKAKGNSTESRQINLYLDEVKSEIVNCFRDLKNESKVVTPQLIKARFLGEDKKNHSLRDIIDYHNEKMGAKLAPKTLCHYETSQKYILEYVAKEYKKEDIFLQDLDYQFVLELESFLRSYQPSHYQDKIGNNAVMKHI